MLFKVFALDDETGKECVAFVVDEKDKDLTIEKVFFSSNVKTCFFHKSDSKGNPLGELSMVNRKEFEAKK